MPPRKRKTHQTAITLQYRISKTDIERIASSFTPSETDLTSLGILLHQQVKDRFSTEGRSGGNPWPQKAARQWGYDDGRSILTGDGGLLRGFAHEVEGDSVSVFSIVPYAVTHQLGTVGKGGVLPTIRPKKAKALFIPITDKAKQSEGFSGREAVYIRHTLKMEKMSGKVRAYVRRGKEIKPLSLVQGRLNEGRLQIKDRDGDWVDGVPDFIFLKKVDIPPRPMLPDSPQEREDQMDFIVDMLG